MRFSAQHLERNKAIAMKVLNGYTMTEVGEQYRLSRTRVAQILLKAVMIADYPLGDRMRMSADQLGFARKHFDYLEPKIRLMT